MAEHDIKTIGTAKFEEVSMIPRNILLRNQKVTVGDVKVTSKLKSNMFLECIQAGTTAGTMPSMSTSTAVDTVITDGTAKFIVREDVSKTQAHIIVASAPSYYQREELFETNKTTVTIHPTWINIGDSGYILKTNKVLNLAQVASWDNSSYTSAANRAGKDFYIYACVPENGYEPKFVLSISSTIPSGYTAANSRKIGGFHCLCLAVGTISGHTLSGYLAGDILPQSAWDLNHRAVSENEGMVWIPEIGKWVDIYLASWDGYELVSEFGATIADGGSSKKFHGDNFVEELGLVGKSLLWRDEFIVAAKGSNENANIVGSADPGTTGGHKDTANHRMVSNYGLEDCCGALWQWGRDMFEIYGTAANTHAYWDSNSANKYFVGYAWQDTSVYNNAVDSQKYGSCHGLLRRVLLGGSWGDGSSCGSRATHCPHFSSRAHASLGARGASEPRQM